MLQAETLSRGKKRLSIQSQQHKPSDCVPDGFGRACESVEVPSTHTKQTQLVTNFQYRWREGYRETNRTFETVGVMSPLFFCLPNLFQKDLPFWSYASTILI